MRRLTILQVGYPLAPVGPDAVGGSEQVLSAIDRALVAAGHRSLVVASADSVVAGRLLPFPAFPPGRTIDEPTRESRLGFMAERIARALAEEPVDLVHMHGLEFHRILPAAPVPVLATLHLPASWYPDAALAPARPRTFIHGVSISQHATLPPGPALLPPILNGVPVERLDGPEPPRRRGAAMLARVCPEKGLHLALAAARRAGLALTIGGELFPYEAHLNYFRDEIAPLLDARRRFVGPLDFAAKRRLLTGSACLLIPSLVAETCSLVAMEAAACGTPVVAFRTGALPEVVEEGVTGFLVEEEDVDAMAAAMGRVAELDPERIRATARRRFAHARMTRAHLDRYRALCRVPAEAG